MIKTLNGQIYDAIEIDNKTTELETRIENIVIAGGGVDPTVFQETVHRLDAEDTTLKSRVTELETNSTIFDERLTVLEETGDAVPSATFNEAINRLDAEDTAIKERLTELETREPGTGTGDVTTEMLNEVKTELESADTALSERVTALEAGGGSGGGTDELLVLTLDVDVEAITDTTTWLLKETINFDALYQSYFTKTNKPVIINIGNSDDTNTNTSSILYSFRDVITIAEDTQIRITGDAMSAAIAPNLRFTIDLALIKDEATGNCIINTTESKFLMQEDTGGGSGEAVAEKIFEFTGEYLLDPATDESTFTVNIDAIDSDKFKEAIDDNYKFQLCLRAPQTQMPIVITTYMLYALQTSNYVFMFNLDSLGMVSEGLYGSVQIAVIQNEDTGNYELGQYHIDKGDDDSLNLTTLDKRVTALEENGSGGGSTEDLSNYTYIIDSQEKFDAFCAATNATEADGNDYSHVYIKNGNYTIIEGHAIRLDNEVVPILSITGESQEGVVITIQATHVFFCVNDNTGTEHIPCIQRISFISADLTALHSISEKAEKGSSSLTAATESKTNCAYELIDCLLNVSGTIAVHTLRTCTVKLTVPTMTENDRTPYNKYIKCERIQDSTITIDCTAQLYNNATNITMLRSAFNTDKSTIINTTVILDKMFPPQGSSGTTAYSFLSAIVDFTYCNNSHCFLADSAFMLFTANSSNITDKPCHAFRSCENVTNCSATNFKVSFYACTNISDSIAYIKYACIANQSGNYYYSHTAGFESCEKVINCSVKGAPSLETDPINSSNSPIVPEGDYSVTSNLRAHIYGFVACALLVNCTDDITAIHSLCAAASLQYISFTNCGSLIVCGRRELFTYNVYKTLNTSVTTPINITFFANCDSLTNAYIHCRSVRTASNSSRALTIKCTDKRENKSSPFITESLALNMCVMRTCRDISQSFLCAKFIVDSTLCTHSTNYLLNQCKRVITSQCMAYGTYTKGAISTVGIQNCTITSPDTATCSASQAYVADYVVADTPAGGFNKIL